MAAYVNTITVAEEVDGDQMKNNRRLIVRMIGASLCTRCTPDGIIDKICYV